MADRTLDQGRRLYSLHLASIVVFRSLHTVPYLILRDHQGVSSIWLFEPGSFGHNSVYASCTLLGTQASSILGPARLCYTLNGAHWWERFCLFWRLLVLCRRRHFHCNWNVSLTAHCNPFRFPFGKDPPRPFPSFSTRKLKGSKAHALGLDIDPHFVGLNSTSTGVVVWACSVSFTEEVATGYMNESKGF